MSYDHEPHGKSEDALALLLLFALSVVVLAFTAIMDPRAPRAPQETRCLKKVEKQVVEFAPNFSESED